MEEIERKIYKELRRDGRVKLTKLSKKLGVPVTTIHKKLKGMLKSGRIQIKALPVFKKLGYPIKAFVLVKLDTSLGNVSQEDLVEKLCSMKGVVEAHVITGSWDIIAKVACKSIDELRSLVLEKFRSLRGVAATETLVVLYSKESELLWV